MGRYVTFDDHNKFLQLIAEDIVEDDTLIFFARDLGFPDYTMIHKAVKPILAKYAAELVYRHGNFTPDAIAARLTGKQEEQAHG